MDTKSVSDSVATFNVDDVPNEAVLVQPIKQSFLKAVQSRLSRYTVEAAGTNDTKSEKNVISIQNSNGLFDAIAHTYSKHFPLTLSPSIIHLALCQAIGIHINQNAERLRHQFVNHERKQRIVVRRDQFRKGSAKNDWVGTFPEFTTKMKEFMKGETNDLFAAPYSTSTTTEIAAAQVTLMSAMQSYFAFECHTMCGIPKITLEGTVGDWEDLQTRMQKLSVMDPTFQWWFKLVDQVLTEFVKARKGNASEQFWHHIFKRSGGSGGPFVSGWINVFFPYTNSSREIRANYDNKDVKSVEDFYSRNYFPESRIPDGLAECPFVWKYYDQEFNMKFLAGFVGVQQNRCTLAMGPCVGWAVVDTDQESSMAKRLRIQEKILTVLDERETKIRDLPQEIWAGEKGILRKYVQSYRCDDETVIERFKTDGFEQWYKDACAGNCETNI